MTTLSHDTISNICISSLLACFLMFVFAVICIMSNASTERIKMYTANGYEQVMVPGSVTPIWQLRKDR